MAKLCLSITVVLSIVVAPALGAGPIEDRVSRHIDAAVEGGLTPTDFHHLIFAFSWRGTLEDWTIAERGLDRLAGVHQVDPLMVDEIRLIRAKIELERGRQAEGLTRLETKREMMWKGPIPRSQDQ